MNISYILVTGASGFIGKYMIDALFGGGYKALALVRNSAAYKRRHDEIVIEGDLADLSLVRSNLYQYEPEVCIHLAWEGIPDYSFEQSEKNLKYGIQVLRLCKDLKIKQLIVTGSCWEYKNPEGRIGESWLTDDSNHFKAAKNAFRMIGHAFCKESGICFNWLRLFYVYGPGQREGALIPYICKEFLAGRTPVLSGINNQVDFIYVSDVSEAIVQTMKVRPQEEILNIGSGKTVRVSDIQKIISNHLSITLAAEKEEVVKNELGVNFFADMSLSNQVLELDSKISPEEGILRMINSYLENFR